MPCSGHDIAWRGGLVRSVCQCGWLSPGYRSIDDAVLAHRAHAPWATPESTSPGPASITLPRELEGEPTPRCHWHVTEAGAPTRLLRRPRVHGQTGVTASREAYRVLTSRTSELMLDGWELDLGASTDRRVVLVKERATTTITVHECWEVTCVASLRSPSITPPLAPSLVGR
ncbi:MAG: hypothetical protein JWN67_2320 [Actinomycetia bacterium]|nr:hypothetical protein [Actinomycetes bacterium]